MSTSPALLPVALHPLPLGSIRPRGWLRRQLEIQRDGLSGHLDEFWPDIADSAWIGGAAEGWERGPYWLDGVVPLAHLLDDARLKAKVTRWIDYILEHQQQDGWLGPVRDRSADGKRPPYDPWPVFVVLKAFTQYQEASADERVIPTMRRFFVRLSALLRERPLFDWGHHRWADLVLSVHWLYERTGERWLLDLARVVHDQGFDWRGHFEDFPNTERTASDACDRISHVVNNAMAIKAAAVWYRQSHQDADRVGSQTAIAALDRYHGQATGVFTGDEHLAGLNPSQGTELCAVNEYLYSLEVLLSILGEAPLADRLERIAYNALPATFSPDMWAHQYDQQANQVICAISESPIYTSNGPDSNTFGVEPCYGCCTANLSQGWPKFAAHLWMTTPDGGIAAVAHAPSQVAWQTHGVGVRVTSLTDYPFAEHVCTLVETDGPIRFPLYLRIPGWAEGATVAGEPAMPGTFHRVERTWSGEREIALELPMPVRLRRGYHDSISILRGPLVYSLRIGEEWRQIGGQAPHSDFEVYPTTPWAYALLMDVKDPGSSITFCRRGMGDRPFSPDGAPIFARVRGRRLTNWKIEHGAAGPLPKSPVRSDQPTEDLILIPYGCTNLRVTEFPVLNS